MATNPLIPLQGRVKDISGIFNNALLGVQRLSNIQRQAAEAPDRARILQAQAAGAEAAVPTAQQISNKEKRQEFQSIVDASVQLNTFTTDEDKLNFAKNRRDQIIARGKETGQPVNTEDTDLFISKLESGDSVGAQSLIDNSIKAGQQFGIIGELKSDILKAKTGAVIDEVKSTKINDAGIVTIVRKSGKVETVEPTPEEAELIKRAEERGVDVQQRRAQGRVLGKDAAKISTKAFEQTEKIRDNNNNLRKVIDEVRGGAETGPLAARLPSFRAESVRLERLRNQLGLDVVGSVTFGALSEGELNLALSTALPTTLDGPELVKWAEDKIAAQEKLAAYLEDQSIFLSEPGNSIGDWLTNIKSKGAQDAGATEPAIEQTPLTAEPQAAIQSQIQEGSTATNPTTGQKVVFTNGQWQPAP